MSENNSTRTISVATYTPKEKLSDFKKEFENALYSKFSKKNIAVLNLSKNYASFALQNLEDSSGNPARLKFMLDYNFKRFVKDKVVPTHVIGSQTELKNAALNSRNSDIYVLYDNLADGYVHEHLPHVKSLCDLDQPSTVDPSKKITVGELVDAIIDSEGLTFKK